MATNDRVISGFQVNRPLLTGGVALTAIGTLLSATGTVVVCAALIAAGRSWVRGLDTPPTELAQRALRGAKVASNAGWEAWRTEHSSPN